MPKELTALFCPNSVAIVGASRSPEKVGAVVLQNIINSKYEGKIFAVNPNSENIGDVKCYKSIGDLPEIPDLAVIAVPAAVVTDLMTRAGEKGIKNFVILTAGFKETGIDGVKLEKQLEEIAKKYNMNILGPNCLGFVNTSCPINATFAKVAGTTGNLRFISQSGAIAASLFDWCASVNLGFSDFVTLGNKTILDENDILEYFLNTGNQSISSIADDGMSAVHPIGLYLESITNGERFMDLTRKISQKDPIFIIKPGKSAAAASAMKSHTGAIAGSDDVLETALKQSGVLRCNSLQEFFDISKAFSWEEIPKGPRVAVISNAGGPAVITADAIVNNGLEVAEFDDKTKQKLTEVLPRAAAILDPVDVMGDALPDRYAAAIETVLETENCDSLLVILTPQIVTKVKETAEIIGQMSKKYKKPIFCSFIGGNLVMEGIRKLDECKIPSFEYPEQAVSAIGAMWKFSNQQQILKEEILDISVLNTQLLPDPALQIIKSAISSNRPILDNQEADAIVSGAGIQTPPSKLAENLEDAKFFAENVGYPVVLKLSSPGLVHKKHVGGVIVDIRNQEQLDQAWETLIRKVENLDPKVRDGVRFQIQKEVPSGTEVIVGIKRDPTFGPVLLFGAGGSLAEMIADKNLRLLPVDINTAKELVAQSKVYSLLKGDENEPAHALDKLYDLIVKLGKLAKSTSEITDIEINPAVVTVNDVWAVDSKVFLEADKPKPAGPKFKTAVTLSAELLAGKTRYFEFEMEENFEFKAGQYVSVKVSDTRINCYSIAGQETPNKFNLLVDSTPGGPGSKFFESLKAGDKITYLGPFGNFQLKPDDGSKNMLFLATGCGTAPFKYMVKKALENNSPDKNVSLYIGVNNYEDVFLKDYFENLTKEHPNFKVNFAIKNPNEKWKGHVGFINEIVKKDYPNAKDCSVYMCGSKFMIEDATEMLKSNGCPPDRIYMEKI